MDTGAERGYGGCEGPDAMYVKLISSDGHEFIVKREHALTSGTIKGEIEKFLIEWPSCWPHLLRRSDALWSWSIRWERGQWS